MAFKINPIYDTTKLTTPVYTVPLEEGILGEAQMNGTILVSDQMRDVNQINDTIDHEAIHIDQMKTPFKLASGEITKLLSYDDDNVYWKGKVFPRSEMEEGDKELEWEVDAYRRA